jgi:hypothetical protein
MGRFLRFLQEIVGRHCLPAIHHSQDVLSRVFAIAVAAGVALAGVAMRHTH